MPSPPDEDARRREEMRDVAVKSLIANVVGLGVQLGIIVAIAKRDAIKRAYLRYRWHVRREWRHAHEQKAVAELRRDVARMEHEGMTDA